MAYQVAEIVKKCENANESNHLGKNIKLSTLLNIHF